MKRVLVDKKPFEFSARVTLQLGRESISNSTVAISELIKNSYDADATSVNVDFHIRNYASSTLVISDDGNGMSTDELMEYWLTVGTENKNTYSKSKHGRINTGAKGLGRLGIDRLCKHLVLYTKKKGDNYATQINVSWKKYEKPNAKLSEIKHDVYRVDLPIQDKYGVAFSSESDSGTRMLLLGLKDNWNDHYIVMLENELRLLVSPFYAKNEFNIKLSTFFSNAHSTRDVSSEIIFKAAPWKVKASVNEQGVVTANYINNIKDSSITEGPTSWSEWIKHAGETAIFGPVDVEFYYIPERRDTFSEIDFTRSDFQNFMKVNRGVRIYRDNFRVRPYGEPSGKGDWLDIGLRKASSPGGIAQGGWRIGPNQIIGAVLISRTTNAILNDQANREGIVENEAFFQLRAFIIKLIQSFEAYAHRDAKSDLNKSKNENSLNFELLTTKLEESRKEISKAVEQLKQVKIPHKSKSATKFIAQKVASVEKAQENQLKIENELYQSLAEAKRKLDEQKDTLTNLASLGILTVCFGHEIRQQTGQMKANCTLIEMKTDSLMQKISAPELIEIKQFSRGIVKNIYYVENYSKLALGNIKPDKRTRKKINIPDIFKYVFSLMKESFDEMGISAKITPDDVTTLSQFNVMSFEIDWESIAINLITNAVWAMELKPRHERFIEVEFTSLQNGTFNVHFRDSGIGLEDGSQENIFMPMNSGKRDMTGNIIGTGMGLSIVKNHVENHTKGTVTAIAKSSLGGAEFIFKLPVAPR
ncbi:ATP-binding protein [Aeromonas jandaei]|uniref:ATP-binding protein n=1 Tax=Aeromonas jandaei TaxID=650 RepID=UPI003BA1B3DA